MKDNTRTLSTKGSCLCRKMIQDIVRNADDKILNEILRLAENNQTRDAVFSMIELMADDVVFTASEYKEMVSSKQ